MESLKKQTPSSVMLALVLLFFSFSVFAQSPKSKGPDKSKTEHIQQVKDNAQTKGQQGKDKAAEIKDKVHEIKAEGKPTKDNGDGLKPGKGKDHINAADHPGKGKGNDFNTLDEDGSEDNEQQDGPKKDKPKVEKEKNGHGYGKDKGDLSGREFGQQRAAEAKLNNEKKAKELNTSISNGEDKLKDAKDKIKSAKEKIKKEKASGQLTDAAYKEKVQEIENAEKLLQSLEEKLEKAKQLEYD